MRWSPRSRRSPAAARRQAPGLDGDTMRILDQAEQVAKKAGDSYVTVERILLAMALAKTTDVGKALAKAGVTPQALNAAIEQIARRAHRRHPVGRGPLRRAEEIRARPHRGRARRQARPGHRPRRGNPPHHPGARPADQEQSGADRRARASARPRSPKASRCASPTATCPTASRTGACCRSTWAR